MSCRVTVVAGMGFGDEGKGTTVDWLTRRYGAKLVVRYNGGAQAGHNVVTPDGRHHCFSQWGSGTFAGARTLLSEHVLVNPIFALSEAKHLEAAGVSDPLSLLEMEGSAFITTPFHVAANRLRELARRTDGGVHGSCGMGIGETRQDMINGEPDLLRAWMIVERGIVRYRLRKCQERKLAEVQALQHHPSMAEAVMRELSILTDPGVIDVATDAYVAFAKKVQVKSELWLPNHLWTGDGHVVFEGAQGVLLDENLGFHPHTTWSDCTFANAMSRINQDRCGAVERMGVLRTFHTRHGAGPFPSEDHELFGRFTDDDHNKTHPWQEGFRAGSFDMVLARYALDVVGGVDSVAFTHVDKLARHGFWKRCVAYAPQPIGDVVHRIPTLARPPDLQCQEELGHWLKRVNPVCTSVNVDDDDAAVRHVKELSEELRVSIAMISRGPSATDKATLAM